MINIEYDKPTKLKSVKQSIYVSFEYNQKIVTVIRTINPRFYNADNHTWELPYSELGYLRKELTDEEFSIIGKPIDKLDKSKPKSDKQYDLPEGLKTEMYDYQIEDYNTILNNDKFLNLSQAGLGKSLSSIASALKRKELGVKHTLYIVCYCSIVYNMYDQIKTHTGQKAMIVGSRKNKRGQWVVKGNADKLTDLKAVDKDTPYFMITNVQSLQNKDIYSQLKKMVDKGIIDYIIVDELHVCRSSSSIQGKALLNLHPKYFLGLTGTLLTNKATDAYVPLRLTNKIDTPFYRFCNRYCIKGNFNQIVGYRHLDEIQKMIGEVSLRRLKSDVLELPPKIIMKDYVDLGKKQAKLYNDALNGILSDIDKIDSIPTMLACMSRLRQITETAELLSSTITESSKIDRLKEIIGDLDKKEKVVIFTWFSDTANIIKRELEIDEPNSCAVVTGKTKNSAEEIERFKTDSNCRYFIATIKSAGVGLTLTEAHTMIMLSLPWTATDFEQATSRIHRISMDAPANIYVLLARNTIDERVYDIVSKKKALSDCLVDNKLSIKELTKMLAEG